MSKQSTRWTYSLDASEDRSETEGREDVQVVSLSRFINFRVVLDLVESGSRGEENATIRRLDRFLERTFGLTEGVREGKDDGTFVVLGHEGEDLVVETASHGRESEKSGRFDVLSRTKPGKSAPEPDSETQRKMLTLRDFEEVW